MDSKKFCGVLSILLMVLAASGVTHAAVYTPVTDASLVDRSAIAIVGRVENSAFGSRFTSYDVSVERVLKGSVSGRNIKVGVPGSDRFIVAGMPKFDPGQRVILFLEAHSDGMYRVVDLMLGAFKEVTLVNASETRAFRDLSLSTSIGGDEAEPSRDFESFASWIEARGRGARDQGAYARPSTEADVAGRVASAPFTLLTDPPARFNQFDTGASVQWFLRPNGSAMAAGGATAFQTALAAYNAESRAIFKFTYGGTNTTLSSSIFAGGGGVTDGVNGVMINDPFNDIAGVYNCTTGGILAFGGYSYLGLHSYKGTDHGSITEGEIIMQDGADCAFTQFSESFGTQIFAHEIGHVIGLGHSCGDNKTPACVTGTAQDDAMMRAYAYSNDRGARFGTDDLAGFVRLYEKATVVPVVPTVASPTSANVTKSGATLGGSLASDGAGIVSERGVVYSITGTNSNPTIGGTGVTKVASSSATTVFTAPATGLVGSTGYSFRAFATNSVGTGYSSVGGFTTLAPTVPGAPTIARAVAANASAIVDFTAPTDNGGAPINGYKATCGAQSGTGTSTSVTVSGLINGTAVTCTVQAQNSVGLGAASAASSSVTPIAGLPVVGSPTSTSVSAEAATIGGTVSADGGTALTERGLLYSLTSANASPLVGGTGVTKVVVSGTATGTITTALSGLTPGTSYSYRAYAINGTGTGYSNSATFTTLAGTTIPRLVNLSTRGFVGTGDNIMIGGFIVGGSGPKKVVIRGRGPSMAALGVPGTLSDPAIRLFNGANPIEFNDNWQTAANSAEVTASGQAPTFTSEAALLTTVSPNVPYTVHVTGVGNTTGIGIVEVFELDQPETPLLNISTRGPVLTGDNILIGGFIIQGDAAQQVLIVAKGPSLGEAPFLVPGSLPDPTLELYSGATVIESNDNWVDSTNAAAITATGNAPTKPLEAAILRTLAPGAYTAIVKGKGTFQGIGLVEVYKK